MAEKEPSSKIGVLRERAEGESGNKDAAFSASIRRETARPTSDRDSAQLAAAIEVTRGAPLRSTVPPSSSPFTMLDAPLLLPEHTFFRRLDDLARRVEMLAALLQVGGMSRQQGARAVQATLSSIAASADDAQVSNLGSVARALQRVIGELVEDASAGSRVLDVLVLDESEIWRDFVALAVEAQGHLVRCAKGYDEFVGLLNERLPDLVVSEVELTHTPPTQLCSVLRELLEKLPVRLVLFSALPLADLDDLGKVAGASAAITKEDGLPGLVAALGRILAVLRPDLSVGEKKQSP